jgi:hypothetical protein
LRLLIRETGRKKVEGLQQKNIPEKFKQLNRMRSSWSTSLSELERMMPILESEPQDGLKISKVRSGLILSTVICTLLNGICLKHKMDIKYLTALLIMFCD